MPAAGIETLRDRIRARAHQIHRGACGQRGLHLRDHRLDFFLDRDRIAGRRARDIDHHRRILADVIGAIAIAALDTHAGDIPHRQLRAVLFGADHQGGNFGGRAPLGAGGDARSPARNIAGRVGRGLGRDHVDDLAQRDVMGHQRHGGHLDHRFRRRDPGQRGARHPLLIQPHDRLIAQPPQLLGRDRPGDHQIGYRIAPDTARDLGLLGALGQVSRRRQRVFHIIDGARHVPVGFELERNSRRSLGGAAFGIFHPLDRDQRGFEHLHDRAVHLFGPRPVPFHRHRDRFLDRVGKELRAHPRRGHEPSTEHDHQHDVGQRGMAREQADHAARFRQARDVFLACHPSPRSAIRAFRRSRGAPLPGATRQGSAAWPARTSRCCPARKPAISRAAPRRA